jgi:hypothetical protein
MFRKSLLALSLAASVLVGFSPSRPATAANMADLRGFVASCHHFSVDVSVTGVTNDQDSWDRFRFQVVDSAGQTLFQEDSARRIGITDRAWVIDMPYAAEAESAVSPIRFQVIDLDMLARPIGTVLERTADSACLTGNAGYADRLMELLPNGVKGVMKTDTPLYTTANGQALDLTVNRGREFTAIYVSPDRAWTAIYVGGDNLVWVRSIDIDLGTGFNALVSPPVTLDPSQQVTSVVVPGVPVSTARALFTVRVRQGPGTNFLTIGRVRFSSIVAVYGRTADSNWILVSLNGIAGWSASRYYSLIEVPLRNLPVLR